MASSSGRKSGSSGRSTSRKRVVIGAQETVRVRYTKNQPQVETERKRTSSKRAGGPARDSAKKARSGTARAGERVSVSKRQERERRQQVVRLKRIGLIVLAVVGAAAVVWGVVALASAPFFAVRAIAVEGERHLTEEQVRSMSGIDVGQRLPRVDVSDAETAIEADPWVSEATVDKQYPGTVNITVVERTPAAIVDAGGTKLHVIATDGTWLGPRSADETGLVVIRDIRDVVAVPGKKADIPEVLNALALVKGLSRELREQASSISAASIDKTLLMTEDDVEIFFGEATQVAQKDRIARELLAKYRDQVVYINVRVVDSPTWRGIDTAP